MKSKAPLSLIEQLVMLLVFALAAAVCLRVFAYSGTLSRSNEARSDAVLKVQTCAEVLKSTHGDLDAAAETIGGAASEDSVIAYYDADFEPADAENAVYTLTCTPLEAEAPLGSADIGVVKADGSSVYSITVCWQEAAK